jgi:N-acetylmuramoyl-L-alanine amidase
MLLIILFLQSSFVFKPDPLAGKIICLDAGHGGTSKTDFYRQGPTGEREEYVNLRVAKLLQGVLESRGAKVIMARTGDDAIPLAARPKLAVDNKADLFLSIHHNATADSSVNFPIIYFHGNASENEAGVALGKDIAKALRKKFYGSAKKQVSVVSDHTVFAAGGAGVLRGSYGIPAVLSEASFFTNPKEESLLKREDHNRKEAEAYLAALETIFSKPKPPIAERYSKIKIPPFRGLQEADRMSEVAKNWYSDYEAGLKLLNKKDTTSLNQAYELFTRSARSFPDSYVAAKCHENRALIFKKLGKLTESKQEENRVKEYYVNVK